MTLQKLEIIRLAEDGQIMRKITCLSGRISVFRAKTELELFLYAAALQGKQVQEPFSITLDGKPFVVSEHINLIPDEINNNYGSMSVSSYLMQSGMPESALKKNLEQYELTGLAQATLASLDLGQMQILKILSAMQQSNKVLLMHNPFEAIASELREKIAEDLANHAWNQKALVVITKLDYRPKCWIENEVISRIQLERPRQLTIGYGGAEPESVEMIAKIRTELKSGVYNTSRFSGAEEIGQAMRETKGAFASMSKRAKAIIAASLGLLVLAGGYLDIGTTSEIRIVAKPILKKEPKQIKYELDGYSSIIQQSINVAFNNPESLFPAVQVNAPRSEIALPQLEVAVQPQQAEIIPNQALGEANALIVPELSEEQLAEQRDRIRQNFLRALESAPPY